MRVGGWSEVRAREKRQREERSGGTRASGGGLYGLEVEGLLEELLDLGLAGTGGKRSVSEKLGTRTRQEKTDQVDRLLSGRRRRAWVPSGVDGRLVLVVLGGLECGKQTGLDVGPRSGIKRLLLRNATRERRKGQRALNRLKKGTGRRKKRTWHQTMSALGY